jgi:Secretion system C-terminal sorting domain
MRLLLLIIFIQMSLLGMAQDKIIFEYDQAGNQVVRRFCPSCSESKTSNGSEVEYLKFFPEDVISYYPNPVKDELFLKWELVNQNTVKEIQLFDVNGKLISIIKDLTNKDNTVIQFSILPKNIYLIVLVYNNEEVKSIKIVKE